MLELPAGIKTCPPLGKKDSAVCLIGDSPTEWDIRNQEPYFPQAPAGSILIECLAGAGLIRSKCYITYLFKFKIKKFKRGQFTVFSHPTTKEELWHSKSGFTEAARPYIEELENELKLVSSNVIVPLGNAPLEAMTGKKGITKWRGSILRLSSEPDRKVIGTIDPFSTSRGGDYLSRYYIIFDFRRIKKQSLFPDVKLPEQVFMIEGLFKEYCDMLDMVYDKGMSGTRINFDIEIKHQEITHISYGWDLTWACSVPFRNQDWSAQEEIVLWKKLAKIHENPAIRMGNQNILFDMWVLALKNKILTNGPLDDCMAANHILYPDFPKGLGFLTSIHTLVPFYKDDGKVWDKDVYDEQEFRIYSAQDSAVASECMNLLDVEIDKTGYRKTYDQTMALYPILLGMMIFGIKTNHESLKNIRAELVIQRDQLQAELNEEVGSELNVNSAPQMQQYFYTDLKIPPYRKKNKITTDDTALSRLAKGTAARAPIHAARLCQQIRGIRKLISTYLDITFDPDARMRCSWNSRGTTTGRLSSSQTLFGTGMNQQNLPLEFKQFLVADDGYLLVELDKAQAEWVVVAYAGGDARMMEVHKKKLDPHARTGQLITDAPLELILKEAKVLGHETNPDTIHSLRKEHIPEIFDMCPFLPRNMTIRQCGKKANHGSNYGMGYKTFALRNEVIESDAKIILEKYHRGYPMIRGGFHAGVQRQLEQNNRTLINCFGRQRRFLDRWGPDLLNAGYDFIAQSTVADLINMALIAIYYDEHPCMDEIILLSQVHDSILMEIPVDDFQKFAMAIHRCCEHMNPVMEYDKRRFQIDTDMKIGLNWRDMEEVAIGSTVDGLAQRISSVYAQLRAPH